MGEYVEIVVWYGIVSFKELIAAVLDKMIENVECNEFLGELIFWVNVKCRGLS